MLTIPPFILAQQVAGSAQPAHEFSQSTMQHVMDSAHGPVDLALVGFGVVIVMVTTIYSVLYLVRPGERGADHIKRRILQDGHEAHR